MTSQADERRLAAIVSLDVVGYSRLMEADEAGTFARLKAYRQELAEPTIAARNGRVVKLMGDGMLVEFASAVDALACAIALQRGLAERNAANPTLPRIEVRAGINVGDVIVESGDIFGDGVNIAARLQALAEPGTIYVSGDVQRFVGSRLDVSLEDCGLQTLCTPSAPMRQNWGID
ncbi:MAG: adenylate/guanylate cyclase domain-containing protein [Alphaproteobacteria bacterium]|nr:adenylate/guanylate cyclase domain-containing protein [Alphaproteobacteria bacterium]